MKTLYIPVNDTRKLKTKGLTEIVKNYNKILVTSTIQFKNKINQVTKSLKNHEVITLEPVLGCTKSFPESDATIIITTGEFHALNIAVKTKKPVFIISPDGIKELDKKLVSDFKKKQAIRVSKVLDAKVIGVLVSTKSGQENEKLGIKIVSELRSQGKEAYLFIANELSPLQLNDYPLDAWINTACPRIIEDEFEKPIINWDEIQEFK